MEKSFIDVEQDSPRTRLGIPVSCASQGRKTIPPLTDVAAQSDRDLRPTAQARTQFLVALPVVSVPTPIELSHLHH